MKYAIVKGGVVENVIVALPYNLAEFPDAVEVDDARAVAIGDSYVAGRFYRADKEILIESERQAIRAERVLTEAVELAQASQETPSATVGVLIDGLPDWEPGKTYKKLHTLFVYDGKVGFTRQAGMTAQETFPPFSAGTESLYGVRPAPDADGVYPYCYNMAAKVGMRVRDEGVVYVCIQAIDPMLHPPGQIPAHFKEE